jgi:hypothetical protein
VAGARFWSAGAPESSRQRLSKSISPQAAEAIIKLRLQQPSLAISTLVRQLEQSGVLQLGTFSLSSVYRLLVTEGLVRPRLIAEGSGPTKAFETDLRARSLRGGPQHQQSPIALPSAFQLLTLHTLRSTSSYPARWQKLRQQAGSGCLRLKTPLRTCANSLVITSTLNLTNNLPLLTCTLSFGLELGTPMKLVPKAEVSTITHET